MKKTIIALALAGMFGMANAGESHGSSYDAGVTVSYDADSNLEITMIRGDKTKVSGDEYMTEAEAKAYLESLGLSYNSDYYYAKVTGSAQDDNTKKAFTTLNNLSQQLTEQNVTVQELVQDVKAISDGDYATKEYVDNADQALQSSITSLSGKITSNAEAINNNKANIASLGNDIGSLKNSTSVNEANIVYLNNKIDNEVEVLDKADEAINSSVKANTDLINQNTNRINSLNIASDNHEVRIANLESTIEDIEELGGDGNDRTTLNVKSESVKSSLTITPTTTGNDYTYTLDFTDLEGSVSSLQTQVKDHDDSLTNAWRKLLANSADIANQGERITNAEVSISSVSDKVATNSKLIQNNTDAINANSERIDNTQADVAKNTQAIKDEASTRLKADQALANSIESNASSIKIINQVNAAQDDAIKSNKTAIADNSTRLDTHYQYIKANRDDIDNLYDVTSTNTTDIANNAKNISINAQNISTNANNIKNVAQSVDEFKDVYNSFAQETVAWNKTQDQNIDNLFKAYESIQAQTVDYDNKFKQQDKRISRLENKMKKMDKRIDKAGAITTALAGIHYQQMHKGEGQIAGAVGGFGGESAIAFGVAVQTGETWQLNAQGAFGNGEVGWSVGFSKKF